MLDINKKSYVLCQILISSDSKLCRKVRKCLIDRFFNLEKNFARLHTELYVQSNKYIRFD